jgi:hypothetical protein
LLVAVEEALGISQMTVVEEAQVLAVILPHLVLLLALLPINLSLQFSHKITELLSVVEELERPQVIEEQLVLTLVFLISHLMEVVVVQVETQVEVMEDLVVVKAVQSLMEVNLDSELLDKGLMVVEVLGLRQELLLEEEEQDKLDLPIATLLVERAAMD